MEGRRRVHHQGAREACMSGMGVCCRWRGTRKLWLAKSSGFGSMLAWCCLLLPLVATMFRCFRPATAHSWLFPQDMVKQHLPPPGKDNIIMVRQGMVVCLRIWGWRRKPGPGGAGIFNRRGTGPTAKKCTLDNQETGVMRLFCPAASTIEGGTSHATKMVHPC